MGDGSYVYMTSFAGAYNAAVTKYTGADLSQVHKFKIPVFDNMPDTLCQLPAQPGMRMDNVNSENGNITLEKENNVISKGKRTKNIKNKVEKIEPEL